MNPSVLSQPPQFPPSPQLAQSLYQRETYPPTLALSIETLGQTAVSIANRWRLGWPLVVNQLIERQQYLSALHQQTESEKDMLADAVNLSHLTPSELRAMYDLQEAPPSPMP